MLRWLDRPLRARRCTGASATRGAVLAAAVLDPRRLGRPSTSSSGSGFLPEMDEGAFVLDYITPAGTSLAGDRTACSWHIEKLPRARRRRSRATRAAPERSSALAIAEPNTGDFLVKLKRERTRSLEEVTDRAAPQDRAGRARHRRRVPAHPRGPDRRPRLVAPAHRDQGLPRRTRRSTSAWPTTIEEWLPKVKGVVDVVNQNFVIGPAVNFRVDVEKAQRAGFGVTDVANLEAAILDGEVASDMIRGDRLIGIRVRYPGGVPLVDGQAEGAARHLADRPDRAALEHRPRRGGGGADGDPPREPAQPGRGDGAARGPRPRLGDRRDPEPPLQGGGDPARHRHRVRRALPGPAGVVPGPDPGAAAVDPADLHHPGLRVPLLLAPHRDPGGDDPLRLRARSWPSSSPARPSTSRRSWARSWWSASSTRTAS